MNRWVKSIKFAVVIAAVVIASVAGCSSESRTPTITVFAASSLVNAFQEMGAEFERERANTGEVVSIRFSFLSSATAATQIIEGAPADLFASANRRNIDRVVESGMVQTVLPLAENQLSVAVSVKSGLRDFGDLAKGDISLVFATPQVPAGEYAREVIRLADMSGNYGEGFYDRVMNNLVSEEVNVRAALAKVQLGEADAAIVYRTDILGTGPSVRHISIPDEFAQPADYWIVALTDGDGLSEHSEAFFKFATTKKGKDLLKKYGFSIPETGG